MSRTVVAAALTLAALALPTVAHAEVVRGPEPVGDELAWQVDMADPACGDLVAVDNPEGSSAFDLTGIAVRHKRYRVALTARFAEPHASRSVELNLQTPRGRWLVEFDRDHGHRYLDVLPEPKWRLEDIDTDGDGTTDCQVWSGSIGYVPCKDRAHASLSADHRAVEVVIPRHCLGNPRWVRAGGLSAGWQAQTAVVDFWDPAAPDSRDDLTAYDPNEHVYGPRVHAGPAADDSADSAPVSHGHSGAPSNRSRVASSATETRRSFVTSRTGFPMGTTAATAY